MRRSWFLYPLTTPGDLLYAAATTAAAARLAIGSEGDVLTVVGGFPAWSAAAASGANTALSNLASVAINTSLISDTDATDDLGSALKRWNNIFGVNLGATGTRFTKLWAVDAEFTNLPTINGGTLATALSLSSYAPLASPTFSTSITGSYLTASEILITDASKNIVSAPVATYPSLTELTYLKGVTSSIQTQIDALSSAVVLKGTWDASVGTFPGAGVAQAGWSYIVSVGGTVDGAVFTANDRIVAIVDNASATTYAANWFKLDYTDAVLSVFGRTGAVVAVDGDYSQSLITGLKTSDSPQFAGIELGHATQNTLSANAGILSIEGVAIPTISSADTLSNKTLTAPKFANGGFLADANGNELLIFTTTASAVNELTYANAATGANPTITASGGDANVGIDVLLKGTGTFNIKGNATQAAELRLYEDTDAGTNYTAFKVGTQTADITYTLPTAVGAAGTFLKDAAGDGVLSWAAAGGGAERRVISTIFETSTRFTTAVSGTGAVTFDGNGGNIGTGATANSKAALRWSEGTTYMYTADNSLNPAFSMNMGINVQGTDYKAYFGFGNLTIDGTNITFTGNHTGIKVIRASSASTASATNANGTTETATIITWDTGDNHGRWYVKKSTTDVKFYLRGSLLATHTTNLQVNVELSIEAIINNANTAADSSFVIANMSLSEDAF